MKDLGPGSVVLSGACVHHVLNFGVMMDHDDRGPSLTLHQDQTQVWNPCRIRVRTEPLVYVLILFVPLVSKHCVNETVLFCSSKSYFGSAVLRRSWFESDQHLKIPLPPEES